MSYDTADPKAVKKKALRSRLADKDRAIVVQSLMAIPQGRRWVYEILVEAHVFNTSFAYTDARTNFNEGERNVGLVLLTQVMTFAGDKFAVAQKEYEDDRAADERDAANDPKPSDSDFDESDAGSGGSY